MRASTTRWRRLLTNWPLLARFPTTLRSVPLWVPSVAMLAAYVVVLLIAIGSVSQPASLRIRVDQCGQDMCVREVTPGGTGWFYGARVGMRVTSINGQPVGGRSEGWIPPEVVSQISVVDRHGSNLYILILTNPFAVSTTRISLWVLGSVFALLGSAVLVRRPNFVTAWMFGLFCLAAALALAIGPASAADVPWGRIAQGVTLVGVSFFLTGFAVSFMLVGRRLAYRAWLVVAGGMSIALLGGFGVSLYLAPDLFAWVRPGIALFLTSSVLASAGLLLVFGVRQKEREGRLQSRIALLGIALGVLPFASLSLVPETLLGSPILPTELTVLASGLIPATFAYAILQHQMLGIRRLVHRGMAYILATSLALIASVLLAALWTRWTSQEINQVSPTATGVILLTFTALFLAARRGAFWVVDHVVYQGVIDYRSFLRQLQSDVPGSGGSGQGAAAALRSFSRALGLESALAFLGESPDRCRLAAREGRRSGWVLEKVYPDLGIEDLPTNDALVVELHHGSDTLLWAPLRVQEKYLGYLVLGPREGGEVFLNEEKQLVGVAAPLLALALDQAALSEQLRWVNQELVKAEEVGRRRFAQDLHDGPLQRAILLTEPAEGSPANYSDQARQLVRELREICSQLRPAILDDLGIVPALDWVMDEIPRRSRFSVDFQVHGLDEVERLEPDLETAIFRVAQEATNNAMKHSRGTTIRVVLAKENGKVVLEVADDGVGFSLDAESAHAGLGLPGMRERLAQLGGRLELCTSPGAGTKLTAHFPLG